MPSLAHEGNPKQDEIVISAGDVLSTAQLDINFASGVPFVVVPPENPGGASSSSSCPDTLLFAEGGFPGVPLAYNDNQSGGSITSFSDQNGIGAGQPSSSWLSISLETGTNCCACSYAPIHMVDIPTIQYVGTGSNVRSQAVYPCHDMWATLTVQGVSDHPHFGICIFVEDGSTVHDFTGYVLAADVQANVTRLMRYEHQSLCGLGTIIDTIAGVPNGQGDTFYIEVFTDPNGSSAGDTIWSVNAEIEDENGANIGAVVGVQAHHSIMDVTYTGVTVDANTPVAEVGDRHNRANVGVVAIGGSVASGIAIMGADTTHFGVLVSGDSFCFASDELS